MYLTAADASGMMVSFIQSNYMGFGSGVVVDGISLQNRGGTFVVQPGPPELRRAAASAPTRPSSPASSRRDGKPVMSFGVMGGTMQPQGHAQVMVRIADYGQSPQAACDGPRFRVVQGMDVSVEDGIPAGVARGAAAARPPASSPSTTTTSSAARQLIWKLDGGYFAASDPRRDGQAVGF